MIHRLALVFLALPFILSGQNPVQKLDRQLANYEVNFERLMRERGLPYYAGEVDYEKVRSAVGTYCMKADGEASSEIAFLFYHHEKDTLFVWLFEHHGLRSRASIPITADSLIALNNTLKFALSIDHQLGLASRGEQLKSTKRYRLRTVECREIISEVLFPAPVIKALNGKKHLLIVPSLNLTSIPFSLLKPWGETRGMLIDSLSFSFVHNFVQLFEEADQRNYSEAQKMDPGEIGKIHNPLVVGNPAFADSCTSGLPQLPGAEREVKMVGQFLGTTPLTGKAALRSDVLARMPSADFIYFATHGWSDTEYPLDLSYLAFYSPDGCGAITPRQLQTINFEENPLVILSACQSGLGKIHEAGIIGLARAFLKKGARSVLMSLWNVDDAATAQLMKLYMEELSKPSSFSPAEPWRKAVLRFRQQYSKDPSHWAAFQQFGIPYRAEFDQIAVRRAQ